MTPRLRPARGRRRLVTIAAIAAIAGFATACGGGQGVPAAGPPQAATMPQICTRNGPVVFAVSGRRNSPAPVLTGSMRSAAAAAVSEGSSVGVVNVDGRPGLVLAGAFTDPGANSLALAAAQQQYLGSLEAAVEGVRASAPHVDVLDALNVAGHAIRAACPHGGTIYLEDSGLEETGWVNFTQPGMLGAAPATVVAFLTRHHELPYLSGMTVVLVGFGDTAAPQAPLSISQQEQLTAIWSAIAKAGGATSVRIDPLPLSGAAPAGVPAVTLVHVPVNIPKIPGILVGTRQGHRSYTLTDKLGDFAVDSAALTPLAKAGLDQVAADIVANAPGQVVTCTGSTDGTGTAAFDLSLSRKRAVTVCDYLASQGVNPRLLHIVAAGKADPSAADAALRRVIITTAPA
jgi:OOP family OmpA-OmpF porin